MSSPTPSIHLVEPGGRGGVYQHTLGLAIALREAGVDEIMIHTAEDAEDRHPAVLHCPCMRWSRCLPSGVRQAATAVGFLARTLPHLVRTAASAGLVHVQGLFGYELTTLLVASLRVRGVRVAFSPHNTFARSGSAHHEHAIRIAARQASVVFGFSHSDVQRLASWGADAIDSPLILHLPDPPSSRIEHWRARYGTTPAALLAGQVRADKRPDLFLEACALAGVTAAVVGPAHDGEALLAQASDRFDVRVVRADDYVPLQEFAAAVRAADVVVASHAVGSVSGPLALASEFGVRSVTFDVGGLGETAGTVADGDDAASLASAIRMALASPPPPPVVLRREAARQHLIGYRQAGWPG